MEFCDKVENQIRKDRLAPVEKMAPTVADYEISAPQLCEEYRTDAASANRKYKGKWLKITGDIDAAVKDYLNQLSIQLSGLDGNTSLLKVHCLLSNKDLNRIVGLERNQKVAVKGKCTEFISAAYSAEEMNGLIVIKDCVLLEPLEAEKAGITTNKKEQFLTDKEIAAMPADFEITSWQLGAEFYFNEIAADNKYKGKQIRITGEFWGDERGNFSIRFFDAAKIMGSTECVECLLLNNQTDKIAGLIRDKGGQFITLQGEADPFFPKRGCITVKDCKLLYLYHKQ